MLNCYEKLRTRKKRERERQRRTERWVCYVLVPSFSMVNVDFIGETKFLNKRKR